MTQQATTTSGRERKRKANLEVYRTIKKKNLLQRPSYWTVYELLYRHAGHEGLTGSELNSCASKDGFSLTAYHTALASLRDAGVVEVVGQRRCKIKGGTAQAWDVTDKIPDAHVTWPAGGKRKRRSNGKRPTTNLIIRAAEELKQESVRMESRGRRPSVAVQKTVAWLGKGAPDDNIEIVEDWRARGAPNDAANAIIKWLNGLAG